MENNQNRSTMTMKQIAIALGATDQAVAGWARENRFPSVLVDGERVADLKDAQAFFEQYKPEYEERRRRTLLGLSRKRDDLLPTLPKVGAPMTSTFSASMLMAENPDFVKITHACNTYKDACPNYPLMSGLYNVACGSKRNRYINVTRTKDGHKLVSRKEVETFVRWSDGLINSGRYIRRTVAAAKVGISSEWFGKLVGDEGFTFVKHPTGSYLMMTSFEKMKAIIEKTRRERRQTIVTASKPKTQTPTIAPTAKPVQPVQPVQQATSPKPAIVVDIGTFVTFRAPEKVSAVIRAIFGNKDRMFRAINAQELQVLENLAGAMLPEEASALRAYVDLGRRTAMYVQNNTEE